LNACLAIAIGVLVALGVRLHSQYGEFLAMREVVDKQTFYEGTTVEGVDVSKMTLSNALDYWRERVEARNAGRTVTLDDGTSITAGELGYSSDYESVLTMAWSHGRSGTLEERYRMAASRIQNPAAYAIHRTLYSEALVDRFVQMQSLKVDQEPVDASVADFNVDTYEFTFNPSRMGRQLDAGALKRDLLASLEAGGGSVTLSVAEQPPAISTEQIGQMYGLIDYAITNASSSSKARLNNITLAMSMINGTKLAPGETFPSTRRWAGARRTGASGWPPPIPAAR
jgi:vancomycin resistance protein YoaR